MGCGSKYYIGMSSCQKAVILLEVLLITALAPTLGAGWRERAGREARALLKGAERALRGVRQQGAHAHGVGALEGQVLKVQAMAAWCSRAGHSLRRRAGWTPPTGTAPCRPAAAAAGPAWR